MRAARLPGQAARGRPCSRRSSGSTDPGGLTTLATEREGPFAMADCVLDASHHRVRRYMRYQTTAAATAGAATTAIDPAAIPPPKVAPAAASPEEIPAALRPGTSSALTAATLPNEPATAPAGNPRRPAVLAARSASGKVVVLAQRAARDGDARERGPTRGENLQIERVGRLGLEPRTHGLKARTSRCTDVHCRLSAQVSATVGRQ